VEITQLLILRGLTNKIGDDDYGGPGNGPNLVLSGDPNRQTVGQASDWEVLPHIHEPTDKVSRLIQQLATISTPRNLRLVASLRALLEDPSSHQDILTDADPLESVLLRCKASETSVAREVYTQLVAIMELAIWVDQ
jgi:hypothetical protein